MVVMTVKTVLIRHWFLLCLSSAQQYTLQFPPLVGFYLDLLY